MNPKEAMKLAMKLAKDENQIRNALTTAWLGYGVCGYTEEWEQLMQRLLARASEKADATLIAMVAQVYYSTLQQEIQSA